MFRIHLGYPQNRILRPKHNSRGFRCFPTFSAANRWYNRDQLSIPLNLVTHGVVLQTIREVSVFFDFPPENTILFEFSATFTVPYPYFHQQNILIRVRYGGLEFTYYCFLINFSTPFFQILKTCLAWFENDLCWIFITFILLNKLHSSWAIKINCNIDYYTIRVDNL